MSWGVFDRLKFGAKPVWLLKLNIGGTEHFIASGSAPFTTLENNPDPGDPSRTWRPGDVVVPDVDSSAGSGTKTFDVSIAINDEVSAILLSTGGRVSCSVSIYQAFRKDPLTECRPQFFGTVIQLRPSNDRLVLACNDNSSVLDNEGINRVVQIPCPYMLFSPECGVLESDHLQTVTLTGGTYLTYYADLSAFSSGQFNYGRMTYGNEASVIISNTQGQINLNSRMPGLEEAMKAGSPEVQLLPGCSKSTAACVAYGNLLNYGGFPNITRNPYDGNGIL